jgi:hypothetical protein
MLITLIWLCKTYTRIRRSHVKEFDKVGFAGVMLSSLMRLLKKRINKYHHLFVKGIYFFDSSFSFWIYRTLILKNLVPNLHIQSNTVKTVTYPSWKFRKTHTYRQCGVFPNFNPSTYTTRVDLDKKTLSKMES